MLNRRGFLTGMGSLLAAPAIVRAASLMPIRAIEVPGWPMPPEDWMPFDLRPGAVNSVYGQSPAMLIMPDLRAYNAAVLARLKANLTDPPLIELMRGDA